MMISSKRVFAAAAATAALSVGGAAVVSATGHGDAQQAANFAMASDSPARSAPVSAPSERLAALDVFKRGAQSGDQPPADLVFAEARSRGAQLTDARKVLDNGAERAYALPVQGGVCLTSSSYVVQMCLPDAVVAGDAGPDALMGFQSVVCSPYMDPERLVVYGLIPSGVENLRFVRADGSTVGVPVETNFAYYSLAKGDVQPVSATWQNATGQTFSGLLPMPADAGRTACDTSQTPSQAVATAKRQALAATAVK